MQIETIDRRTFSGQDARSIAELLSTIWPKPGRTVDTRVAEMLAGWKSYVGPEEQYPRSFVIRNGERVVSHAEVSPRTIGTDTGDITVGALAGVCTYPEFRGRRL